MHMYSLEQITVLLFGQVQVGSRGSGGLVFRLILRSSEGVAMVNAKANKRKKLSGPSSPRLTF